MLECRKIKTFFKKFGFVIHDTELFRIALTHKSYLVENNINGKDYERLEFLGDSVLKLCSSEVLFDLYPQFNEGMLTKIRSILVSDVMLCEFALKIHLEKVIFVSGSAKREKRSLSTILACTFEAILGALYLHFGLGSVKAFLKPFFEGTIVEIVENIKKYNGKALLQEYTQSKNKDLPEYELVEQSGVQHELVFTYCVKYHKEVIGQGNGSTKKQAQQMAAYDACKKLGLLDY